MTKKVKNKLLYDLEEQEVKKNVIHALIDLDNILDERNIDTLLKNPNNDSVFGALQLIFNGLNDSLVFPLSLIVSHSTHNKILFILNNHFHPNIKVIALRIITFHFCRNKAMVSLLMDCGLIDTLLNLLHSPPSIRALTPIIYGFSIIGRINRSIFVDLINGQNFNKIIIDTFNTLKENAENYEEPEYWDPFSDYPIHIKEVTQFSRAVAHFLVTVINMNENFDSFYVATTISDFSFVFNEIDALSLINIYKALTRNFINELLINKTDIVKVALCTISECNDEELFIEAILFLMELTKSNNKADVWNVDTFNSLCNYEKYGIKTKDLALGIIGQIITHFPNSLDSFLQSNLLERIVCTTNSEEFLPKAQSLIVLMLCFLTIPSSCFLPCVVETELLKKIDVFIDIDNTFVQSIVVSFLIKCNEYCESENNSQYFFDISNAYIGDLIESYSQSESNKVYEKTLQLSSLFK